jgi:TPR repeat protein
MRYLVLLATFLSVNATAVEGCDISCKIEKGLRGDGDSALEVAREAKGTQSPEIVTEWYRIAAENGSAEAQFELANVLSLEGRSAYDCIRADYWYQLAKKNGHLEAAESPRRTQAVVGRDGSTSGHCSDQR